MKVGVIGAGTAGMSSALLLSRDGHDVTVFDRVADPRPIGAGILLQSLGQPILDDLGLRDLANLGFLARVSPPERWA